MSIDDTEHRRMRNRSKLAQQSRPDPHSDCVLWQGQISNGGFGQVMLRHDGYNKLHSAHRAAYQLYIGQIPKGKIVLQACRNRLCINPKHLITVSAVPINYWHAQKRQEINSACRKGEL